MKNIKQKTIQALDEMGLNYQLNSNLNKWSILLNNDTTFILDYEFESCKSKQEIKILINIKIQ